MVCSAYRTQAKQQNIFDQMKQSLLDQGYSDADAETEAGRQVAVPGTSEHQLGLAVDIVDLDHQLLDESQEQTAVQQWLMTNSWRYGFILRYPTAKTETTGIYEPQEAAAEIISRGVCLEGVYRRQIRRLTGGTRNEIEKVSSSHLYKGVADGCISRNIPRIRSPEVLALYGSVGWTAYTEQPDEALRRAGVLRLHAVAGGECPPDTLPHALSCVPGGQRRS